jgi:hypothetical protein
MQAYLAAGRLGENRQQSVFSVEMSPIDARLRPA